MKALVTQYHALDIKDLARGHYLLPFCAFEWVWRMKNGRQAVIVGITVLNGVLQIIPQTDHQELLQEVKLTYSLSTNGGKRPWFSCPACQRRVGVLYLARNLPFRCRECHRLAYPSQYESRRHGQGRYHQIIDHPERDRLHEDG